MDHDEQRTPEPSSSNESDVEYDECGDGFNYSEYFITETVFPTFDEAVKWADEVSTSLGFILVKSSYNQTRDGRPYRYLACDRGRKKKPRDLENAIRKDTKTKANACPFYIVIYYVQATDTWKIRAKNDITGTHNHPMIVYAEGHRKISGLSPGTKKVVRDMTNSKVPPRNIMATLAEQFPDDHPNIRHIYNCRNDMRAEMSEGRGIVQQFLHLARESKYIHWVSADDFGVLQHAFMVHPVSVNILRTYPYVIGMDSTYKTNRYGMPFFEIVGVTPTNQNFLVGYVFMRDETTTSYRWVLHKLRQLIGYAKEPSVFLSDRELGLCAALRETAHFLCRWHINKDVEAKVTSMFKDKKVGAKFKNGRWKRIMNARTENEYIDAVDAMKTAWASFPNVISYVEKTWLCHRTKFVTFWTNQVLHFGNTSNCRVESQHSAVKTWFDSSTGSLDTVWARVHCHIGNQILAIHNGLEASRRKIGEKYRQLPLSGINGKVSLHCLKVLDAETRRMTELSYQLYERCGCAMRVTHGLPCACQKADSIVAQTALYTRQIHPFWKTLVIGDGVDTPEFMNDAAEENAHFRSLVDEVIGSDQAVLRNVSRIIEEELHPDFTNFEEPRVNPNVRGRRRNNDTRRDQSYFEHVNRQHSRRGTQETGDDCDIRQCRYAHLLPRPLFPYITAWKDVIGDGNCGFRCVADFFFGDQNEWFKARETLANEIVSHPFLYYRIYGIGRLSLNERRIRWEGGAVGSEHWMVAIQDLFPIATWFNATIVILGVGTTPTCYYPCLTVLPLRARSSVRAPSQEFGIATVGGSHFIRVDLAPDSPLPPIAGWWTEHHEASVNGWDRQFEQRRQLWEAVFRS